MDVVILVLYTYEGSITRGAAIFTTSKNTTAVFLANWFYNCEFDKIMTTYCHIHSFMSNLHGTF